MMRQAGRYLEEFRAVRAQHDFFKVCTTPQLACEVTLQPLRRFEFDASIIFSDILVIPQALGLEVLMEPEVGPVVTQPLKTPADLERLHLPDFASAYEPYFDAIYLTRHSIDGHVPLLGFCGGPLTLMAYMIEGKGSQNFLKVKEWLYTYPEASHQLLRLLTDVLVEFMYGQAASGAQVLQVFESHAGVLSPDDFYEFCLPYLTEIATKLKAKVPTPLIIFAKGAHYALEDLFKTPYDVISLDWTADRRRAVALANQYSKALQGNLDPAVLLGPQTVLEHKLRQMIADFAGAPLIANLGHGVERTTPPENVQCFVRKVHELSS
jgi:uroporphyrinogen decarboxylase